ncbi:hypothetical protein SODALDRAFT_328416 [Sodiomyces alkalinus F11]|uniref:DUF676 domain-containing protein n=1 Tax=Sodiomyces alkalinus (strain CBS 110278 / VKM F-3762 / F11) TaxID=1314773 RepID=A0A3N2PNM4_SODAK|nr:hypothetical protein SODALDRAFT_328416 [Sodiomyces alkalinus F11]ROT36034.1 hypothetical protein SODALDRAFT_328416 [Sodiomyces alkalinus F11]
MKTLILCFIHGFKGGEDTFGLKSQFTNDLRSLVQDELPKIDVKVLIYPKYETKGDLGDCVSRFRDWLLEKVIDLEVAAGTPSPTVDPSVRTILLGHSMGGIVAAETVIGLTADHPIYTEDGIEKSTEAPTSLNALMFPYIQGVLAFDTPYLGISPGVVAHGAEDHYTTASAALTQLSGLGTALWGATSKSGAGAASSSRSNTPRAALPPPPPPPPPPPTNDQQRQQQQQQQQQQDQQRQASPWAKWGKIAAIAGGAAAVAAGGAAAYMNRDQLTQGWTWATSHLEFVGCLARGAELQKRVRYMARLSQELDVGFANLYTRLGRAAGSREVGVVGTVLGRDRTFCNLPKHHNRRGGDGDVGAVGLWREAVNDAATDETLAHTSMFELALNPGYEALAEEAKALIVKWTKNEWYERSGPALEIQMGPDPDGGEQQRPVGQAPGPGPGPGVSRGGTFGLEDNPWA